MRQLTKIIIFLTSKLVPIRALLLIGVNEEYYQRFMDLLGDKDFTTMEKVHDIIKKSKESANNHALIGTNFKVKNKIIKEPPSFNLSTRTETEMYL